MCKWVLKDIHNFPPNQQAFKHDMYKKPRPPTVPCSKCDNDLRARLSYDDF